MSHDIVYAVDDLSSIGSESAFGEDIPSDVSVGSETSTLVEPLFDTTILSKAFSEVSVDFGYDAEFDTLSDYYESDLESDCEEEEDEECVGDDNSISHHFDSFVGDVEITDDELSFVSDDFDLNLSFSDDEDGLSVISESSRFERSLCIQLAQHHNQEEEEERSEGVHELASRCHSNHEMSQHHTDRLYTQASKIIQHGLVAKKNRVPGMCSLDTSSRLQRTLFRLPSRSVSLDIGVRL